jgi:hypothetical protein
MRWTRGNALVASKARGRFLFSEFLIEPAEVVTVRWPQKEVAPRLIRPLEQH